MNGTRLSRGRGGRLALYGGCFIVLVLLVFLYRAATTEMTRLRELNVQCTHQEEALAAQLQVIFEYKVRLEKSLSEEKNANIALKHELQERATREKTLRDKDSVEATQRFNSLQQQHRILQSEHQDLRDECDKRAKLNLIETGRLETTLQDLRSQIKKSRDDKEKSMEHLKNKYIEIENDKKNLEEKYNELLKSNGNTDSTIEHLNKQVFQLKRELEDAKLNCKSTLFRSNMLSSNSSAQSLAPSEKSTSPSSSRLQQQQKNLSTSTSKISTAMNATKSTVHLVSTSSDKSLSAAGVASSLKLLPRVKLPMGVVPIPEMIVPKIDKEEPQRLDTNGNNLSADNRNNQGGSQDGAHAPAGKEHEGADGGGDSRHVGGPVLKRQENLGWYKVKPGVQEIGDELNHPGKMPEYKHSAFRFGDTGQHQGGGDDQYDNLDYYKEPQPKHNDIHLDEGEEDEGEDEDEQADYRNNPQADKHE